MTGANSSGCVHRWKLKGGRHHITTCTSSCTLWLRARADSALRCGLWAEVIVPDVMCRHACVSGTRMELTKSCPSRLASLTHKLLSSPLLADKGRGRTNKGKSGAGRAVGMKKAELGVGGGDNGRWAPGYRGDDLPGCVCSSSSLLT